jgi:aminoglycoside phosphotransferase (APT) family kinase protein
MASEALTMEHARREGYPVPAIEEVSADGTDLVMERIDGPSMVELMNRRPWSIRHQGSVLGDLHRRLHEIPPPDFLPAAPVGHGDAFLHMDLHPLNVMMSATGPVVIDWPNAARGDAAVDVAIAWLLMVAGEVPGGRVKNALIGRARGLLVGGFLAGFALDSVKRQMRDVVAWKVQDPHMSDAEQRSMWRLVEEIEAHP